jgi:hypothetical protein
VQVDLIPILSTVILATTIVTIILAVGSYFAYKMRDKRRARRKNLLKPSPADPAQAPRKVFRRYRPEPGDARGIGRAGQDPARRG